MKKVNVLIIGAGPAGHAAAKAAAQKSESVLLCGSEPYLPYWRPRLASVISGDLAVDKLLISSEDWYAQKNIECLLNVKVEHIDTSNKIVTLDNGKQISYDKLILALGASPFVPPIKHNEELLTLRSYNDAQEIRKAVLEKQKVVVIGGGLLGLEMAFEIKELGKPVTIVERGDWLLTRQLDKAGGEFLANLLSDDQLSILTGMDVSKHPEIMENACVIVAAGIRSNIQVLRDTGININRAVIVDEYMQTSIEDVYACGDIAEFNGRTWGLVPVANAQGTIAGNNAVGIRTIYKDIIPSPVLKVSDVSLISVGDISINDSTTAYRKQDGSEYVCFMVQANKIKGAIFIGNPGLGFKVKSAIEKGLELPEINSADDVIGFISK